MTEGHLVSGVLAHLGQLHPVVGKVVHHEDEGTHSVHLVAPAGDQDQHEGGFSTRENLYSPLPEGEQGQGGEVVDEHLPKVFALHIGELGHQKRPVERHLKHVVPPNCWIWR